MKQDSILEWMETQGKPRGFVKGRGKTGRINRTYGCGKRYEPSAAFAQKQRDIDLGLDVLYAVLKPGDTLDFTDIARACNCSTTAINQQFKVAMRKIRERIRLRLALSREEFLQLRFSLYNERADAERKPSLGGNW